MALPNINTAPEYELIIPSSGKRLRFRPFLVKEQKVLLIALESKDEKQVLSAINNTILSCVKDNIHLSALTTYDTEYIFTQIRAKSVGETTKISSKCTECSTGNEVVINFDNIALSNKTPAEKTLKLNDQYSIKLRHPSYQDLGFGFSESTTNTQKLIESIIVCLDSLITEDEIIKFKDETKEDIEAFIDNMTAQQIEDIMGFINNVPTLSYDLQYDCVKCGHHNEITLKGLGDFF